MTEETRKIAFICSKGNLDMAYPALIMGWAALGNGIEVEYLKAASVSAGFAVSAAGIILASQGVTKTFEFMSNLIDRI